MEGGNKGTTNYSQSARSRGFGQQGLMGLVSKVSKVLWVWSARSYGFGQQGLMGLVSKVSWVWSARFMGWVSKVMYTLGCWYSNRSPD